MRWEECLDKLPRIDSIELEVLTVKSTVKKKDLAVPSQTPKLYLSSLCLKNRNDSTACCPMLNAGNNMKSRDDGAARDERSYFLEFSCRRCGSFQVRIISSQAIISFSFVSSSKRRKKTTQHRRFSFSFPLLLLHSFFMSLAQHNSMVELSLLPARAQVQHSLSMWKTDWKVSEEKRNGRVRKTGLVACSFFSYGTKQWKKIRVLWKQPTMLDVAQCCRCTFDNFKTSDSLSHSNRRSSA